MNKSIKKIPLSFFLTFLAVFSSAFFLFQIVYHQNAQAAQDTTQVHLTIRQVSPEVVNRQGKKVIAYPQKLLIQEVWETVSGRISGFWEKFHLPSL